MLLWYISLFIVYQWFSPTGAAKSHWEVGGWPDTKYGAKLIWMNDDLCRKNKQTRVYWDMLTFISLFFLIFSLLMINKNCRCGRVNFFWLLKWGMMEKVWEPVLYVKSKQQWVILQNVHLHFDKKIHFLTDDRVKHYYCYHFLFIFS